MSHNEEWQREQQRVQRVREEIERKMEDIHEKVGDVKDEVLELRETFWEDVTVNIDEPDDIMETYNSLRQQAELLGERERSHKQVYDQLKTLKRMKHSPYFGRVDFTEEGAEETDRVYIGISSLMNRSDEEFLVYDWRAPISSLYYDYSPGSAEYETPEGTIEGDMDLKRQFIIRQGQIKGMFDTGVTIGDELLQEVLGNNANTQMKSIVATIQKEQNQIIRYDQRPFLVVQGVAGSGKTSAALQRVAYLLYRYRTKITADQMMLFSPNPMFNSYVANVLPELGEENIEQNTFQEYMEQRLDNRIQFEDAYDQLEYLLSAEQGSDYEARLEGVQYKASLSFKHQVDEYVDMLSEEGLVFKNVKFKGETIVGAQDMYEFFYSLDSFISIPNRLEEVAEWILTKIKSFEKKERSKDWVEQEIELLDKEEYLKVHQKLQGGFRGNAETYDDAVLEKQLLSKAVVKKYMKPIKKKIKNLAFLNMKAIYASLFHSHPTDLSTKIIDQTVKQLDQGILFYEDVTPFLYLEGEVKGTETYNQIRYLVIDEAQDYSPFQFELYKKLFPNSRMTILGDYNQAIYAHTLQSPTLLSDQLYDRDRAEFMTLVRSYRSTRPIIEFTKHIIPGGEDIEPFNREGSLPRMIQVEDEQNHYRELVKEVYRLGEKRYDTIAIICKTAAESLNAYEQLSKDIPVRLMGRDTYTFSKGIIVIPAYLAKGIEFDAVILFDASDEAYSRQLERNLFYTACTRAMHELTVMTVGRMSRFIDEVPEDHYTLS